jgi:hypothetical protein
MLITAIYDIRIVRPCSMCAFLEWKYDGNMIPNYWSCSLFNEKVIGYDGLPCTLGEKNDVQPCGECRLMIERLKKIPEADEIR